MLLQLPGYCEIPLWEKIPGIGSNWHPETLVYRICGYTTVDADNYRWLIQYRWFRQWNSGNQSYYVYRNDRLPHGKYVHVFMAREILGLPRDAGKGQDQADHIDHSTLKNTRDNLRIATFSQSMANRRKQSHSRWRFKGIYPNKSGFHAHIRYNWQQVWLPTVRTDVEAALTYNYAAYLLWGEFAYLNQVPDDEMPSEQHQRDLWDMMVYKLLDVGILVAA